MRRLYNVFIIASYLSISIPTLSQDSSAVKSFEVLEISGVISVDDKSLEEAFVELYEGNVVVDAFETKKNGKFKFTLYSQMIYTIQINKKGFYTKRISVSTKLPADYEGFEKFQFDIGLTSKEESTYDPYLAEYPSALISYDQKKKEFIYDKNYTRSYFDEIEQE